MLILTESWLNPRIPDAAVQLAGRSFHHCDRNADSGKSRGGGLCVLVHNDWSTNCKITHNHCSPDLEVKTVSCRPFSERQTEMKTRLWSPHQTDKHIYYTATLHSILHITQHCPVRAAVLNRIRVKMCRHNTPNVCYTPV